MARVSEAAKCIRAVRAGARLSQRALARRAGTTQSVVARIEIGSARPTWDTLVRLVRAAEYELHLVAVPRLSARSHMMRDVARILRLSVDDRLREVAAVDRFVTSARRTK